MSSWLRDGSPTVANFVAFKERAESHQLKRSYQRFAGLGGDGPSLHDSSLLQVFVHSSATHYDTQGRYGGVICHLFLFIAIYFLSGLGTAGIHAVVHWVIFGVGTQRKGLLGRWLA